MSAYTIFQYYFDEKMAAKKPQKNVDNSSSVADEILMLKNLLDSDVITQEEFENIKTQLLSK